MKTILLLLTMTLAKPAWAATYVPYHPLTKSAFEIGEGATETEAKEDALANIPKDFRPTVVYSSPFLDCIEKIGTAKCRYYLPLEPVALSQRKSYIKMLEHNEFHTSFVGRGHSPQEAESDLLLKTGKKSVSVFPDLYITCPRNYKGKGYKKCLNHNDLGEFTVEGALPRLCFLSE